MWHFGCYAARRTSDKMRARFRLLCSSITCFAGLTSSLFAADPIQVSSGGAFHDYVPNTASADITDLGGGASLFEWGATAGTPEEDIPVNYDLERSYMGFTPPLLLASTPIFSVGDLEWFNGTSAEGSGATHVGFTLALDFDTDADTLPDLTKYLEFDFQIQNVQNANPDIYHPDNSDWVKIVDPTVPFTIGSTDYLLTLGLSVTPELRDPDDGHGPIGFLENDKFNVREGQTAKASLIASFTRTTTTNPSVPDGGTTLAFLGAAVASLGLLRRKMRSDHENHCL